jgi:hypothetical protein
MSRRREPFRRREVAATRYSCGTYSGGLAGSTGLEPAASAVTGQRSSQLNYDPKLTLAVGDLVNL